MLGGVEGDGVLPDDVEEALDRVERRGRVRRDGDHVDRRGTCVEERGRLSSRGVRIARRLSILGKCELRLPSIDDAGERRAENERRALRATFAQGLTDETDVDY